MRKNIVTSIIILVLIVITAIFTFNQCSYLFPTYILTIKGNWGVSLPSPNIINNIKEDRGGLQGDGTAVTELKYKNPSDIKQIRSLSSNWVSGNEFKKEKETFNGPIKSILGKIDPDSSYFYLKKYGTDYIVFELSGNTLTIYESYL